MKLLLLLLFPLYSFAQSFELCGRIEDSKDKSFLPGVSIVNLTTNGGVNSDIDGKYCIQASKGDILEFSFVSYVSTRVTVLDNKIINISLDPATINMDEFVVVGYGVQRKSDLTGSVVSIKSADIAKTISVSPAQAIQGKVAGVMVSSGSGAPGEAPIIRIRGVGTLNDSNPLYVVDGVLLGDIRFLSNNDIKSIEVLKDASATAIYGSRGANGVIIISTKQGVKGKTIFEFNSSVGIQQVANTIDMVNASEYAQLANELAYNSGLSTMPFSDPSKYGKGTNWFNQIYRTAIVTNNQVSVRGGNDNVTFNISASLFDQKGIIEKSSYKRHSIKLNNTYKLSDKIKLGHNLTLSKFENKSVPNVVLSAYKMDPITPVGKTLGNWIASKNNVANPLAELEYTNNKSYGYRLVGNVYMDINLSKDLIFKSSYGTDFAENHGKTFNPTYYVSPVQQNKQSNIGVSQDQFNTWIWENTLNYNKKLEKHNISVLLGQTMQSSRWENLGGGRKDLPGNEEAFWYLNAGSADTQTNYNTAAESSMLSYLFRLNYSFKSKYLFTASMRADGSSRFGSDNKFGYFPSCALGWRLKEEAFLKDVDLISNLKLRASWGQTGNDKIGNYPSYTTISGNLNTVFGVDETLNIGANQINVSNPDIRWETTTQMNLGFNLGLLNNHLSLELDYYNRNTKDILIAIPLPSSVGAEGSPIVNAAEVENYGFDVNLRWEDKIGDFSYASNLTLSTVNNKVNALGQGKSELIDGGIDNGKQSTRTVVGESIGYFYGYRTDGIFQNQQEINKYPSLDNTKPGDIRYTDTNKDGKINDKDKVKLGSPIPEYLFGLNLSCEYKGFDFGMDIQGVYGNSILNAKKAVRFSTYNFEKSYLNRWTGEGTSTSEPRITNDGINYEISDRFIEDGSYVKIQNIQLGYSMPESIIKRFNMSKLRVFCSVSNLKTFTNYSGFSPEVMGGNVLASGIDNGIYPQSTTYSFGINLTF